MQESKAWFRTMYAGEEIDGKMNWTEFVVREDLDRMIVRELLAISGMTIAETGEAGTGARFELTVPKGMYRFCRPPLRKDVMQRDLSQSFCTFLCRVPVIAHPAL